MALLSITKQSSVTLDTGREYKLAPEDVGLVPCEDTGNHPFTTPEDRRSDDKIEEQKEEKQDKQDEREEKKFDKRAEKQNEEQFEPKGRPEDGRPKNAKDKQKRKQKEVQPRQTVKSVNLMLWASDSQKIIAETVHPALLAHYNKKNLRGLTKQQSDELEYIKLCILCNLEPYIDIDTDIISQILKGGFGVDRSIASIIQSLGSGFVEENQRKPNIEEKRQMCVMAYASFHTT